MPRKSNLRSRVAQAEANLQSPILDRDAWADAPNLSISPRARGFVSLVIVLHFAAVLVALASNLAPSFLQGELLRVLSPYLTTTHQSYGAVAIELTHGDSVDFPVVVQIQTDAPNWIDCDQTLMGHNSIGSRWPILARMLRIISVDAPDDGLLSEVAVQVVRYLEHSGVSEVSAVRFMQPHVLNFDEYDSVRNESMSLADFEPEVFFSAKVVRDSENRLGVVPEQEAYRNSPVSSKSQLGKSTQP